MKIAIAGYGVEGRANYDYFLAQGHDVTIADQREIADVPNGAKTLFSDDALTRLNGFDRVVRSPQIAPTAIVTDGDVWSSTNEFFAQCPAPIIGVTGSKGKGTTSSLIASILRAAGHTVHLVGNIGVPAIAELARINPTDIVVYELSSFQLWDAVRSPQIAVVLYIEPEHLDVHTNIDEYVAAKAHIAAHQTADGTVIFNEQNEYARSIAEQSPANKIPYQSSSAAHVADGAFWYGDVRLCSVDALQLPGAHNLDNACAAIAATWQWVQDGMVIERGLRSFNGLPHRLKRVREIADVTYYDDSIATTPGSAIAALRAFDQPKILILGGSDKGADFTELAKEITISTVTRVIVIGSEAPKIEQALRLAGYDAISNLGTDTTMRAVVSHAAKSAVPGSIVILSPACASFGMFKNYVDRGEQFIAAVEAL